LLTTSCTVDAKKALTKQRRTDGRALAVMWPCTRCTLVCTHTAPISGMTSRVASSDAARALYSSLSLSVMRGKGAPHRGDAMGSRLAVLIPTAVPRRASGRIKSRQVPRRTCGFDTLRSAVITSTT